MPSPRPPSLESPPLIRGLATLALLWGSSCANPMTLVRSPSPNRSDIQLAATSKRQAEGPTEASSEAGYMGPMERALKRSSWDRQKRDAVASGDALSIDGLPEYQAAESLYLDGKFVEAEKAFQKLAKTRRSSHETFGMKVERWWGVKSTASLDTYANFGDPIEEDALFMKAECQFEQTRFAKAQDSYDDLLNRYPSTRHLDAVSRRYFQIARIWLGFPEKAEETGDAQVVSDSTEEEVEDFANVDSFYIPIVPNFLDKSRPAFDTRGRALQALRSVWLHDATGPLADDALMVSASFHLRTQDFEESARLYKLLREQYPESPHFRDAFLLGSHVTLASYQGSNYDGQNLSEAIELKEAALRIFPDLTEEERNRLGSELGKMHDAEVARIWDRVEYFQAKQAPESVAVYCKILINRFPDTEYAERGRKILEYQAHTRQRRMLSLPQMATKPTEPAPPETGEAAAPTEVEEEKAPLRFPKLKWPLRALPKTDETPEAETPDAESEEQDSESHPAPRYQEASANGRSSTGRSTLE